MTIRPITPQLRANFRHLYADIFWWGLLAGSTMAFLAVYATRLGASAFQLSLLSAGPAIVNLFFSLPSGRWMANQPLFRITPRSALVNRLGYIILVWLPVILSPDQEIWSVIATVLLMSIPGTVVAIAFNALFADVVPPDWRSEVVGKRNALMAFSLMVTSLVCGQILDRVSSPYNFQIVFAIGALGALFSTYHLTRLQPVTDTPSHRVWRPLQDLAHPGIVRFMGSEHRPAGLRFLTRSSGGPLLRLDLLRGAFGPFLAAYLVFYTAQYLPVSLFPLAYVRELNLSNSAISLGTALFQGAVVLVSINLGRVAAHYTQRQMLVFGAIGFSFFPLLVGLAQNGYLYWVASVVGGLIWGVTGAALVNRLMEHVSEEERPASMALHNLALNIGVLLGSLSGPLLGSLFGIPEALILSAAARFLAGLLLAVWG